MYTTFLFKFLEFDKFQNICRDIVRICKIVTIPTKSSTLVWGSMC